jgi:hypothetical protein
MANTVRAKIVVQFDDQFTEPAKQANLNYLKSLEEVQKKSEGFKLIWEPLYQTFFENIRKDFTELSTLGQTESLVKLSETLGVVRIALSGFYASWLGGQKLSEWLVGDQPVDKYVEGVKESLDQLGESESIRLPPIPQETVQSLDNAKTCLQQIQQLQDIFITVVLVDNATKEAKQLRQEIEGIFSKDIIQRIRIIEETTQLSLPSFSGSSDSIDSPIELQTPSVDLTGFGDSVSTSSSNSSSITFPGFSSGIERVPRDMLAMIHKDEAVLPKNQAEDFRRSGSRGITIQNLDFSINAPNVLNLDRETVSDLALTIRDEIQRIDQRA